LPDRAVSLGEIPVIPVSLKRKKMTSTTTGGTATSPTDFVVTGP
jgi:hypothetical protein